MKNLLLIAVFLFSFFPSFTQDAYNSSVKVFNVSTFTHEPAAQLNSELLLLTPDAYEHHPEFGIMPFNGPGDGYFELLDHRTANTRYYIKKNTNGREFITQASDQDLHYLDKNGNIITIDPRLKSNPLTPGVYSAMQQPDPTSLNMNLGYTSIQLIDNSIFKFNALLSVYNTDDHIEKTGRQNISRSTYSVGDNGAFVSNAFTGIDQQMLFENASVKSNYILHNTSSVDATKEFFVVEDAITLPSGHSIIKDLYEGMETEEGLWVGELILQNQYGIELARFNRPIVYDAEDIATSSDAAPIGGYIITQEGNTFYIKTVVKISWLTATTRVFPITIDPLVTGTTATWTGTSGADNSPTFCSITVAVPTPANATLTGSSVHWEFRSLGGVTCGATGCRNDDLQVYISTACGTSPSTAGFVWVCSPGCNSPGTWIPTVNDASTAGLVSCYTPQCASFNIDFTVYFNQASCTTAGGCVTTCAYMQRIDIYIEGHTVEGLALTGSSDLTSYTIPDCTAQYVTLNASGSYGVPSYTYLWTPGSVTTSSYFITPAPSTTTVYSLTITDACGNTVTDNVTIINPCLTLPVELVSFNGFENDGINYLNWVTATEENTSVFEIERSVNSEEFKKIGSMPAIGNNSAEHQYTFQDVHPASGINYYRLKIIDADNTFSYSQIISIQSGITANQLSVDVTSNPTSLQLNIQSPIAGDAQIILYDITGKEIHAQTLTLGEGRTEAVLSAEKISAGTYFAVIQMNGETSNTKFIRN